MGISHPTKKFDKTAPALDSITPNNSSTNFPVANNLAIALSENIAQGTGNITIKKADGTIFETISVTDKAKVSISNNLLTINPSNDLVGKTDYYVQIDNGAIADLAGNKYAGISNNTTWKFTTVDITPNTNTSAPPNNNPTPNNPAPNNTSEKPSVITLSNQNVGIYKPNTDDSADGVFLVGGTAKVKGIGKKASN